MDGLSTARISYLRESFDLSDLSKTGLFERFQSLVEPFESNSEIYERLWYDDHVKTLERVENNQGKKLGFDSNSDTWFFEQWEHNRFTKAWKQGYRSWGETLVKDSEGETKETWNFLPEEETYEHFRIEPNNEYGSKSGKKVGLEWKEIWHKKPEDSALEKYWISPEAKWGEKQGTTGKKTWSLDWREEKTTFEEKSQNEENGKKWGHVKGKNSSCEWEEHWSVDGTLKNNDRWWLQDGKKWGIKTINTENTEFCEEWEEKNDGSKRSVKSFKDPLGVRTRNTEGSGNGFGFKEEYKYEPDSDLHQTHNNGFSEQGKWESFFSKQGSKNFAKHSGEDLNGNWMEEWNEDGLEKKTWKKGNSSLWGQWEEQWEENESFKHCKKFGKKDDEEWTEEWTETPSLKTCKKQQKRSGVLYTQEWEEKTEGESVKCKGHFLEDSTEVKSWDYSRPVLDLIL
jgi:hypothetical protein